MRKVFIKEDEPVIYFRFHNNVLMYIGETHDLRSGRPFRNGHEETIGDKKFLTEVEEAVEKTDKRLVASYARYIGDYDKVITITASRNEKRRRYWEAYMVVKLQPLQQNIKPYNTFLKRKDFSADEKEQIEMDKTKKWKIFSKNNKGKIIRSLLRKKLYALINLTDAEKCLKVVRKDDY